MQKSNFELQKSKRKEGFTLVELIIVIAIIAILAAAIFVAVDPARRLHEARNARRSTDIATILDAIKTYQADSKGDLPVKVEGMTAGLFYQIGTDESSCNIACQGATTEDGCVDLSGIGSSYLARVPFDPKEGEAAVTGYGISKDSNGALTILGCYAEGEGPGGGGVVPEIIITR